MDGCGDDRALTSAPENGNIISFLPEISPGWRGSLASMAWHVPALLARATSPVLGARLFAPLNAALLVVFQFGDSEKEGSVYNILWALVFGFATLNILGLVARRFEPSRTRLSFGESVAIMVVVVSVFLLGWEMLYVFGVLPIRLQPHY